MRARRCFGAIAVLLVAVMAASGAGTPGLARSRLHGSGLQSITLQLAGPASAEFAGYFVAADKGFYRQQGLNVTIRAGGTGIVPERVVTSGAAQFGIDWLSALLVARENKLPLINIAQIFQASGMRLIAFKNSGINAIADFKGHRIGVWPPGREYQFYELMYKEHLWPPSHFMTIVGQGPGVTQFLSHQVDVAHAMSYDDLGAVLEHGIKKSALTIWDYNQLGVALLEDGIFSTQSYLHNHHSIAVRFLRASIKGWQWTVAHPTLAGQLTWKHLPSSWPGGRYHQIYMARQVAQLITYAPSGGHHSIGYMDPALYQRTWSTLRDESVIQRVPQHAYTQVYWQAAGGT